jgi:Flp pilus assembly protein TadB
VEQKLFAPEELPKFGTGYLLTVAALAYLVPHRRLFLSFVIFVPILVWICVLTSVLQRRGNQFRIEFRRSLGILAIKMNSGRSFRQAFSEVTQEVEPAFHAKMIEIGSAVVFSPQESHHETRISPAGAVLKERFLSELIDELVCIDRQPHAGLKRLAVLRERMQIEEDFRRKSGTVLSRIRAQSIMLSLLYILLLSFVLWRFGWFKNRHLVTLSATLFVLGTVWIWFSGRRIRWRV